MPHSMLSLQPRHQFHMLLVAHGSEQTQPVVDGLAILFSIEGKYDAGPFVFESSVMVQTPFLLNFSICSLKCNPRRSERCGVPAYPRKTITRGARLDAFASRLRAYGDVTLLSVNLVCIDILKPGFFIGRGGQRHSYDWHHDSRIGPVVQVALIPPSICQPNGWATGDVEKCHDRQHVLLALRPGRYDQVVLLGKPRFPSRIFARKDSIKPCAPWTFIASRVSKPH